MLQPLGNNELFITYFKSLLFFRGLFIFMIMEIKALYKIYKKCNLEVCTDTRIIKKDSLFIALSGGNFNGNMFIKEALSLGCKYAICDDESITGHNIINVNNSLKTLQDLANYHRSSFDIPLLAITGSNGKTTTKELLVEILLKKFNLLYTLGNLNNHIGVPLTLLNLRDYHDFALIEMGANKPNDIKELCEIADPTHGMITNIGTAHIEGFGNRDGVVKTKTEMYRYIINREGILFVNNNEAYLNAYTDNYPHCIEFGGDKGINFEVDSTKYVLELLIEGNKIKTKLFGRYNANNVLTAYVVGKEFLIEQTEIRNAIDSYSPKNNRSQIKKTTRNNQLILDAYNANPSSLNLAIDEMISKKGDKLFIVGDMKELGSVSEEEHKAVILKISKSGYTGYLIGPEFNKYNDSKLIAFETVDELINSNVLKNISGLQILIKGSRSVQLEKVEPFL